MTCGDEVICESNDIAKKIVSIATDKGLYPEAVQAKVDEILNWIQTDLYPACGGVSVSFINLSFFMNNEVKNLSIKEFLTKSLIFRHIIDHI